MIITKGEYEGIYKTITAICIGEGVPPHKACVVYTLIGAAILEYHFNLNPEIKIGKAFYNVGADDILAFSSESLEGNHLPDGGFHCWLEVEGYLIDFMSPEFPTSMGEFGEGVPRNMLQKKVTSQGDMTSVGGFLLEENPLQGYIITDNANHPLMKDVIRIGVEWHSKRKGSQKNTRIVQGCKEGSIKNTSYTLKGIQAISGAW